MLLEISVPVYKKDRWKNLERHGKIQVSSEVDTLSDGYKQLKTEIDALMAEIDGQTRLADEVESLQRQIDEKSYTLGILEEDIEKATKHYNNLKLLLERFGIDPKSKHLTFDTQLLLTSTSETEVDVIQTSAYKEF